MGGRNQSKRYVLTEAELALVADVAAEKAISTYQEQHKVAEKERQNKVLNSAKTLVKNYRRFKAMTYGAVYDGETITDETLKEVLQLMNGNFRNKEFEVLSIKEKALRTKTILDHVDSMLEVYRKQCEMASDPEEGRRYRVINGLYIADNPQTVQELAEQECVAERTIFRDRDIAFKRLAILFFGIDGIRF